MLEKSMWNKLIRTLCTLIVICSLGRITISAFAQEEITLRVAVWEKKGRFDILEDGSYRDRKSVV